MELARTWQQHYLFQLYSRLSLTLIKGDCHLNVFASVMCVDVFKAFFSRCSPSFIAVSQQQMAFKRRLLCRAFHPAPIFRKSVKRAENGLGREPKMKSRCPQRRIQSQVCKSLSTPLSLVQLKRDVGNSFIMLCVAGYIEPLIISFYSNSRLYRYRISCGNSCVLIFINVSQIDLVVVSPFPHI